MWSALESMLVMFAITILKGVIKNPASIKKEAAVISAIAQAATEADMAVSGTIWTSTPGAPPTVATA
jgi:hypothetical protein